MQISRHWRLNGQRYRLEGVSYPNQEKSLQNRPGIPSESGIGYAAHEQINALSNYEKKSNKEGNSSGKREVA